MTLLAYVTPALLLLLLLTLPCMETSKPHIVLILADDMGWSDVGFRDKEMATPILDEMKDEGVLLNYSYMLKSCTPSRSTLLTGTYAFRMGLQDSSLNAMANDSVPLDKRFFPQDLQDAGYSTHYVGKWHLGFCRREMTPTYRGFHTFYGMYNGAGDYYSHEGKKKGYDMQDIKGSNFKVDWSVKGVYSTTLFTDKAVEIIEGHNTSVPLFLLLSYQAVHGPLQVPKKYEKYCENVTAGGNGTASNLKRKKHCAMTKAMDEGIGEVLDALKGKDMNNNLITFFTSDNGGPSTKGSSNWPFRGAKTTEWEGGTRVVGILKSETYLPNAPYVWNGMIHAVDWYSTILSMAGVSVNTTDGMDQWNNIVNNANSSREEFVYNLNQRKKNYSIRWRQYKLINFKRARPSGWYNPPAGEGNQTESVKVKEFELFDLEEDPAERYNLIKSKKGLKLHNATVEFLKAKLEAYKTGMVPPAANYKWKDLAHPRNFNGSFATGWC